MAERILVVEDDLELRQMLVELLRDAGYAVSATPTADAALRLIGGGEEPDLVLTDLVLPGLQGQDLLREIHSQRPELNVIVLTAFGTIGSAIELVKAGAFNYLTKPVGTEELLFDIARALADSRRRRETARAIRGSASQVPPGFIGASPKMLELYRLLRPAAASPHPVLITGESGTGKELVARAIHLYSGRGAFVPVNCGGLPEQLLESELFGHERGAFTGAERTKEGLFEVADSGTLFLDEIAELPVALQPKLLRALEYPEIRRVGSTQARTVDVRVVAASNRELDREVELGRFRDDLFWRLNVLHIQVPPLRERHGDVEILAEHFLERSAGEGKIPRAPRTLAPEALALLSGYSWPGNVRELRNAIQHAATWAPDDVITAEYLPPRIRESGPAGELISTASRRHLTLREVERMYLVEVLRQVDGSRSRAAEILGVDRRTIHRKIEEYRAEDPAFDI